MTKYYAAKLSARRLQEAYNLAPRRTRQYLESEIDEAKSHVTTRTSVLELGCGYGRIMRELAPIASRLTGIDNAPANLQYGRRFLRGFGNCDLAVMDAVTLAFMDKSFDTVLCLQNGISAFRTDPRLLIAEALRVCRIGGYAIFSSYSPSFWEHRLEWFRVQAAAGLLGEIDEENTREGTIVCKDGFRSSALSAEEFTHIAGLLNVSCRVYEVDNSSTFCVLMK